MVHTFSRETQVKLFCKKCDYVFLPAPNYGVFSIPRIGYLVRNWAYHACSQCKEEFDLIEVVCRVDTSPVFSVLKNKPDEVTYHKRVKIDWTCEYCGSVVFNEDMTFKTLKEVREHSRKMRQKLESNQVCECVKVTGKEKSCIKPKYNVNVVEL